MLNNYNLPALVLIQSLLLISCKMEIDMQTVEKYKNEIVQVELDFAATAKKEGVPKAFLAYAADDAVLQRGNKIINGKQAIKVYFDRQTLREVKLEWAPDFVDVSDAGDLAYTYGKYTFSAKDSTGKPIEASGIFHTVWKRQQDGSWKYVWD